jgi:thymidylate synthase
MGEKQYLDLLRRVMETGEERQTRNGKTYSVFGGNLHFDLRDGFPLLTSKRVFFRGIVEELIWFIRGKMDSKLLEEKGVNIWRGNTSREFLHSIGLGHYREGDAGPVYGHQWRHFGATYLDCDTDYSGKGIDQLAECIRQIKYEPSSRRIFMSAWNPTQMPEMALPPCHVSYQFYVSGPNNEYLSSSLYCRSQDLFLGTPFNIASVSLLTHILAHFCGKIPKDVHIYMGDAHIYEEHLDVVREQLTRELYQLPTLKITGNIPEKIDDYTTDMFQIENYKSHGILRAEMKA